MIMFADVSDSARLFERLGDLEAAHAVDRCLKRMTRSIEGFRGKTVQIVGDELLAAFETSEDACHAAIDMQQRIADLPPVSGLRLTIRIGLHGGSVTETGGELLGDTVTSTARIVGLARRDQILCSSALVAGLPENTALKIRTMPDLGPVREGEDLLAISQLEWTPPASAGQLSTFSVMPSERLCIRYQGKAILLDSKTPLLTFGRDPASKVLIKDRKASRIHARIEKRPAGYYLVDTSTNGSFVRSSGQQETMVRRYEILLEGKGSIAFGGSHNDPNADFAEFEHL